eukprot:TRINITY_DN940_c0_g1_i1.p1 TRINITY_DN940_c0_g1~~TRINITY_DN940_c0_g1_i1.p1  ORF type:complete len:419 (-),score=103.24 TRINITY_DN940_c0_g1_i1:59-1315(-)
MSENDKLINLDSILENEKMREINLIFKKIEVKEKTYKELIVIFWMLLVISFGAFNRVANKIMTVPMQNYSFFLSLFNAFVYVFVYFIILFIRYKMGIVPKEQLIYPWKQPKSIEGWKRLVPPIIWFVVMGLMDGLGNILGLIATPYISGQLVSLMSQAIILFAAISAVIILRRVYTYWECFSILTVLVGAIISLYTPDSSSEDENNLFYAILMAISTAPNAISFTIKEMVFLDYPTKNPSLDVFIVNSHGSLFQLVLWPIFIPITILFDQTNGLSLGEYIKNGFICFSGTTPQYDIDNSDLDCSPNPWPYLIYIVINIFYNIAILFLLKEASALMSFMTIKAILPISVFLFYIPWPLLDPPTWSWAILVGLVVILAGLIMFRITTTWKDEPKYKQHKFCCSFYMPICLPPPKDNLLDN